MLQEKRYSYFPEVKRSWMMNKIQGLTNFYYQSKRDIRWLIYNARHPVKLDFIKIAPDSIPVIINNFNRFSLLQSQLNWLLSLPEKISIIIVDNNSTYSPLLKYYHSLAFENVQVVPLGINSWSKGVVQVAKQLQSFAKFIITDSDLIPYPDTPTNIISYLVDRLDKNPAYNHLGVSLEINDIPAANPLRDIIMNYEKKFWLPENKLNDELYIGLIDTTFSMYRNTSRLFHGLPALRTDRPYTLKHADWYLDYNNISEEYLFYLNTCQSVSTWATELKKCLEAGKIKASKTSGSNLLISQ